jgi:hypothetical protein
MMIGAAKARKELSSDKLEENIAYQSEDNSLRAFAAPIIIASILIPAAAIGNKPTAVNTE